MQTIKAIKLEALNSVLLEVKRKNKPNLQLWFDLSNVKKEKDLKHSTPIENITGDWNACIFNIFSSNDMDKKNFQGDANNYIECLKVATKYFKNFTF
jgi:hypothetical protein